MLSIDDCSSLEKSKKPRALFDLQFKYYNLTHFDLSRYGIYKENDLPTYNDTNIINALLIGGCSEEKLSKIKIFLNNNPFPRTDFHTICELVKIQIKLRTENTSNDWKLVFGKEYEEVYHIGVLEDHTFIIEPTNITSYCLTNYDEIKNQRDCNIIIKKKSGKYYERDSKRCLDSFNLIRTMLDNKEKLLKEITGNKIIDYQLKYKSIDISHIKSKILLHKLFDKNRFGIEGDIQTEDVIELLFKQDFKCYICNQDVIINNISTRCFYQYSVDRIYEDLPHNRDNVLISCFFCNCYTRMDEIGFSRNKVCKGECHNNDNYIVKSNIDHIKIYEKFGLHIRNYERDILLANISSIYILK
jgi:hypothetical protein